MHVGQTLQYRRHVESSGELGEAAVSAVHDRPQFPSLVQFHEHVRILRILIRRYQLDDKVTVQVGHDILLPDHTLRLIAIDELPLELNLQCIGILRALPIDEPHLTERPRAQYPMPIQIVHLNRPSVLGDGLRQFVLPLGGTQHLPYGAAAEITNLNVREGRHRVLRYQLLVLGTPLGDRLLAEHPHGPYCLWLLFRAFDGDFPGAHYI
mmetsp:Transcript_54976/g.164693  ORF Transcript_54976/g.164693 Transcript_54976/m.164693 type:complete len:209 (-) Transcript_54976:1320-1946(-)